jgi:signal transduction histidine kinase
VLTVQGWFRLVFAVLVFLLLIAAVVITLLLRQEHQVSSELDGRLLPAQAQAYRLQGALIDQETGVRGFGITGTQDFLQPYTSGLATEASAAARLRSLIGYNQQLSADLGNLERAAGSWRRSSALPLIALARRGPLNGKDLALLDQSKSSFNHLRSLFGTQNAHLAAAAARDSASESRIRKVSDWAFGLTLIVFLAAAAVLMFVLRRAVVRPLIRLRIASRRVTGGDFGHRIEVAGPTDLQAVAADVETMRKRLVETLEEARRAQEVGAQQAADLDAQAAELLRSNAELEQFAYVASHDLQEPLRKVASFCQLLEKRYGDRLDERGRQYIDFAVDGAKRLQVLINDLLTFSRVGRANETVTRLPLGEALDTAIAGMAIAIEESGADIERLAPLPEVTGDATLLAMLWQNLIGNAIKFRAPGSPPVVRISVSAEPEGVWQFCVEDNGIGIPAEFAEKIFVIFQRLHGRDAYPGTGIGLALCKRIVEYHGGEISLDASYTEGTRICFTLPQIDQAEPDEPADQASPDEPADQASPDEPADQVSPDEPAEPDQDGREPGTASTTSEGITA